MSGFDAVGINQAPTPLSSDVFERSVFRAAPSRFSIEFLVPTKTSSSYQHGMRISPITRGDRSSRGSDCSNQEYDIWRRWEDCLWLQDILEKEYSQAAREKRTRLAQGKGVKMFNGMYKQDMASSWESLPPGPEPNSVARDVHAYLPTLTKKGTFFRPKPALVQKRQQEFQALVETLMSDEMPALIKEIRASRIITDFFGIWRRDVEYEEKLRKKNRVPRNSITPSVFSAYFSSSASSTAPSQSSPPSMRSTDSTFTGGISSASLRTFSNISSRTFRSRRSSTDTLEAPRTPQDGSRPQQPRQRTDSSGSSSSEEVPSDSSYTADSSVPRIAAEEHPVKFDYNPDQDNLELSPTIESISERSEIYLKASPLDGQRPIHLRRRPRSIENRKSNRNWSVYASPVSNHFELEPSSPAARDDSTISRESWQSTASGASADTYLEGLGLTLPQTPREERDSLASISTLLTIDSATAVISSFPSTPSPRSSYAIIRSSIPVSLSDFEMTTGSDERLSVIDAFPRPLSYVPEVEDHGEDQDRPETPTLEFDDIPEIMPLSISRKDGRHLPAISIPPMPKTVDAEETVPASPAYSTYSSTFTVSTVTSDIATPTSSVGPFPSMTSTPQKAGNISIKASHNGSNIMLKVVHEMSLSEVRQRLYNKFVRQEGVPLAHDFSLMYHDNAIASEDEWRNIAAVYEGSKLSLRVVNPS